MPGAIDTLAFGLTFTGYTDSLRGLLNDLAKFDLPIVVRSIKVERPSGSSTTAKVPDNNNLDAFFGVFDGGSNSEVVFSGICREIRTKIHQNLQKKVQHLTRKMKKNQKFNYSIAKKCWRFLAEI